MFNQRQLAAMMAPLNQNRVSSRQQSGRSLSYLEAWDVKATLIRVFGFANFSADVVESKVLRMEKDVPAFTGTGDNKRRRMDENNEPAFNWSVTALATVRLYIHGTGATYTETAIASQTGPDIGEVADFAMKTAESDALKRAAIYLGTQFGLSLYDNGSTGDVVRVLLEPEQASILAGEEQKDAGEPDGDQKAAAAALAESAGASRVVETDSGTFSGKDEYSPAEEAEQ